VTIACPECGTLEDLPPLSRRSMAVCLRCEVDLERTSGRSIPAALACSVTTLLLLFPVNLLPLMRADLFNPLALKPARVLRPKNDKRSAEAGGRTAAIDSSLRMRTR